MGISTFTSKEFIFFAGYLRLAMDDTVDGRWNQTLAVLLSNPRTPQISMLSLGCAVESGGQTNQTLNKEEVR